MQPPSRLPVQYQPQHMQQVEDDDGPAEGPWGHPPQSLTEQQLRFLDLPDEVPPHLQARLWGLFSRHSQLSNIFNEGELVRARRRIRLICRPMMWENSSMKQEGDISFLERMQIEHFTDLMLRKSYKQQERRLLAPQLQELTSRAEMNEASRSRSPGMLGRGLNAIFGSRR